MGISTQLESRCGLKCELCERDSTLHQYIVPPKSGDCEGEQVAVCDICLQQLNSSENLDTNHWRCLNESIWSPHPPVQVVAYRMLKRLEKQDWAQNLLGMMYLEETTKEWAENRGGALVVHQDSNGQILKSGDTVVLIKDLNVKGAGFTAKRGTAVRRISLIRDNAEHIQGRVNDQTIIILTKFVKKSS